MITRLASVTLLSSAFLVLGACTGGAGTGGVSNEVIAGIEGSGITSAGAVTAKGSILVNGVEFDTTSAVISIDGRFATEADLAVGQVVIVEGQLDAGGTTGTADRVTVGTTVAGPITVVDAALRQLTILGQVVALDAATVIDSQVPGELLGGLAAGDDVVVSGFADSTGVISARRIERRFSGGPLNVTGHVTGLDRPGKLFVINGQFVDYSSATLVGIAESDLEGALVRVTASRIDGDGRLEADEIVLRATGLPGAENDRAVLQGWVTRFTAQSDFDVDGYPVVTTNATRIIGQVAFLNGLRLDAFVTVTGDLTADGTVEATEVRLSNLISLDTSIGRLSTEDNAQYLYAKLVQGRCRITSETGIMIDGVPSDFAALRAGDVATIYEHTEFAAPDADSLCLAIEVEHHVRGPLESKPADSLRFTVMGQNVWLDAGAHAELDLIGLGDIVEVSGHLTADGDILASSVHAANANTGYRVIGLARSVNTFARSFELGGLTIDYSNGAVSGFTGNAPAEGDRVLVISETAPAAGLLRADAVGYTGGMPRGAVLRQVLPQGLITRLASAYDFDVEGRRFIYPPAPIPFLDPVPERRCDLDKLHLDMSFASLMAHGNDAGVPPIYFWALCRPGRRIDERGPYRTADDWWLFQGTELSGPIQAIDLANRTLRIGGFDLMLNPATLLTRFEGAADTDIGTTTPLSLGDLLVTERAELTISSIAGVPEAHAVTMVWVGDDVQVDSEVALTGFVTASAEPSLTINPGLSFDVPPATVFTVDDCFGVRDSDPSEFWSHRWDYSDNVISVFGSVIGGQFVPQRIEWGYYCGLD